MMRYLSFYLRKALRNLWSHRALSLFTLVLLGLIFSFISGFLTIFFNIELALAEWEGNIFHFSVYLRNGTSKAEQHELMTTIKTFGEIEKIEFVSSANAQQTFVADFPEYSDIIPKISANFLPDSLEIRFYKNLILTQKQDDLLAMLRAHPYVSDVQFNRGWIERAYALGALIHLVKYLLLIGMTAMVIISIFITIRLSLWNRASEIEIYRLVGATDWFIKIPFIWEGCVLGFGGALGSLGSVYALFALLLPRLRALDAWQIWSFDFVMLPPRIMLAILLAGIGLGALASFLSIKNIPEIRH
jgi:cell division transport system permease protein